MACLPEMSRRVPVRRVVAATHVSTLETQAEVHPRRAHFETLLATGTARLDRLPIRLRHPFDVHATRHLSRLLCEGPSSTREDLPASLARPSPVGRRGGSAGDRSATRRLDLQVVSQAWAAQVAARGRGVEVPPFSRTFPSFASRSARRARGARPCPRRRGE